MLPTGFNNTPVDNQPQTQNLLLLATVSLDTTESRVPTAALNVFSGHAQRGDHQVPRQTQKPLPDQAAFLPSATNTVREVRIVRDTQGRERKPPSIKAEREAAQAAFRAQQPIHVNPPVHAINLAHLFA